MAHVVDQELCTLCGVCESTCETQAITMTDDACTIDAEKCTDCGDCAPDCPVEAITKVEE